MARTAEGRLLDLTHGFAVPGGHFDELFDEAHTVRPVWDDFSSYAGHLSAEQLTRAQARADRQIHDNGVTYNVYASADATARPWTLDVLPFIVAAAEWDHLSVALRQRARVLNAVAADLYGPRQLLTGRVVPPALVLQHPGFLRACHGVRPAGGVFLHLVAFDLVRAANGEWLVADTRAQAPSGAGYALENRATIARLFPEAFRGMRVHPLGAFFQDLARTLTDQAPTEHGEVPHAVLLTPGPYNETYFEHAFLARYLGFPLVEGGDLTVRRDRVFLKTVSGLRPVHAIIRRLDDDYCDPLELRADSTLGVPGLVEAWRAGRVLMANAFGTGVLESRTLAALLPAAAERLLGESLTLRAVGVGEQPSLSYAPMWQDGRVNGRALSLRVFLAADGQGDYRVMPGGLARIAGEDGQTVSGQRGGGSKDTWALSDVEADAGLHVESRTPFADTAADEEGATPSRAAEHLFWLGRYAERSENCARLLRAVLERLTDTDALPKRLRSIVFATCVEQGLLSADDLADGKPLPERSSGAIERALVDGLLDGQSHYSLAYNVLQTVRVAGAARDRLSSDNWRLLNRLRLQMSGTAGVRVGLDEALEIVDQSIITLVAVGGLEMAHMPRDHGWRFLSIGRHLERVTFVASTLEDVGRAGVRGDPALLEWLLDLSDSLVSYRTRFRRQPEWKHVVEMLLLDAQNPRAATFQLAKLAKHVTLLPGGQQGELAELVAEIHGLLTAASTPDRAQGHLFGRVGVDAIIAGSQQLAARLSDALTLRYFSHVYDLPRVTV